MEKLVLAKVNGKEITQQDMDFFLNTLGPEKAAQFSSPEGLSQILQELVNQELLYFEAKELKLEESEMYAVELERLQAHLLKTMAIRNLFEGIQITEEDQKKYYEENSQNFGQPMQVKASHILVKTEDEGNAVIERLNNGEAFEDVALAVSECPSKERGGDLGFFSKGQMVPEFDKVAFEMNTDDVSELVQTQFGFHVIKLTDKKEATVSTFEEVKPRIEQELFAMKQGQIYQERINNLRTKYEIEIME